MTTATPLPPQPAGPGPVLSLRHVPALDGVRAVAVLAVIVFHYFQTRPAATSHLGMALRRITGLGPGGVDLFFVLSGFLITGILIDAQGSAHALRNFYMRRVLRIFPLYYGFLLVTFVILPLLQAAHPVKWADQWWFWAYCSNLHASFAHTFPGGPEHFWSLSIEEQFYLVWPFLALRFPVRRLAWICAGMIAGALLARVVMEAAGYNPYYFTLCRMDALASGALLASLIRLPGGSERVRVWGRKLALWLTPGIAVAYLMMSGHANPAVQVVKYSFTAALCTAGMVFAIHARPGSALWHLLTNRAMRSIGRYSYGMYVLHPAILLFLQSKTPGYSELVTLPVSIASIYGVAWCVWHLWEQPFLKLKRLFPSRDALAGIADRMRAVGMEAPRPVAG